MFGGILIVIGILIWAFSKRKGSQKWQEFVEEQQENMNNGIPGQSEEPDSPWDFGSPKYFTYDDHVEPEVTASADEEYVPAYEVPEPVRRIREHKKQNAKTDVPQQQKQLNAGSEPGGNSEIAADIFEGGFDLRNAIIYSEIMKPKYEEM